MKDYVVYHNPDIMGVLAIDVDPFAVVTDKRVAKIRGSRVWLLTGQGNPRTYFVRSYFLVEEIQSGTDSGFETKLCGSVGKAFDPMVELPDAEWFVDFKRSQGNFGFGLQPINDDRFIEGLLDAVAGR